jgi:glutaredoxin 3
MNKQTAAPDTGAAKPVVTIYSSPTCGFCHMAMDYFDNKGIAYTERDITVDEEGLNYVLKTVGQAATPVITIDDEIIVGFDRPKIDAALKAATA